MELYDIQSKYIKLGIGDLGRTGKQAMYESQGFTPGVTTERGSRATLENSVKYLYRMMWTDPELHQSILDLRLMDKADGRVKKIHNKMSRTAVKGGLRLKVEGDNKRIIKIWKQFVKRLNLNRQEKLESDAKGLVMEGNLPLQWVVGDNNTIVNCVRMPSETIMPNVTENGVFKDPNHAYTQFDLTTGNELAKFSLWQLTLVRLSPDNYDDMGAMGRPYLDATRSVWKKLCMTEEDLVIRRRERAPLRTAHSLEGATTEELQLYKEQIENDQKEITTNYYMNKKGAVDAVQGDANLDQIADVNYLLDTFFAGSPAPKGLFGYVGDLSRDILEDLKRDYFEEIDALQDTHAFAYQLGFRLELLLHGINPDAIEYEVKFAERRTDTPNQRADHALKLQALNVGNRIVWEAAGLNTDDVLAAKKIEANSNDPYPNDEESDHGPNSKPTVKVTPGNERKGDSGTTINNKG